MASVLLNLTAVLAIAIMHFALATRRTGLFTVDGVYSSVTLLMATGTLIYIDPAVEADRLYGNIFTLGVIIYYCTSSLVAQVASRQYATKPLGQRIVVYKSFSLIPSALIVISIVVGVAYFSAVGYNVFLQGIREFGSGAGTNYQDLRLASYSSGQNLNPGYVNQFKNTILPAVSMFAIAGMYRLGAAHRRLTSVALIIVNLVMLAGTGQRGALVLAMVGTTIFIYHTRQNRSFKWMLPVSVGAVTPLIFLTFLLGRNAADVQEASAPSAKVWAVTQNLLDRVLRVQQESGISVFRFLYERPVVYGREWLDAVLGVLPGHPGTSLPREAFKWLYGTDRGTATPSVWGSAYYNFGLLGVIVLAVIIGFVCQLVTTRFYESSSVTSWDTACYSMFAATFGAWVAGGPEYLLNAGPVTIAILWALGALLPSDGKDVKIRVSRGAERPEIRTKNFATMPEHGEG